ncbi:MAG: nuclear transport factor 2 family protein, partial [Anaerolineales bacterium]|nr:nuclear transport factor 2 family protein [Anaerolineales bacterium]
EESSPLLPADSSDTEEATQQEPVQTGGAYDGSWTGTNTVDDKEILFVVENNKVTSVSLNYTGEAGDCTYHGAISAGSATGSLDEAAITNDAFALSYESVNDELTFSGAFTSESEANGTLLIKSSPDGLCGEYEKEVSWTASKGPSAEAEATEDTSGLTSQDGDIILTQFFDAVNAGDLDSALELVDDNVMFSFGAQGTQFGRDNLEAYLLSAQGVTYQISDAESLGGAMVQFTATASDGTTYSFCNIVLQDSKIVSLTLQP